MLAALGPQISQPQAWALLFVWTRRSLHFEKLHWVGASNAYFATSFMISFKCPLMTSTATGLDLTFQERTHKRVNQTHSTICEQWSHSRRHGTSVPGHLTPGAGTHLQEAAGRRTAWEAAGAMPPSIGKNNWAPMFTPSGKTGNLGVNSYYSIFSKGMYKIGIIFFL